MEVPDCDGNMEPDEESDEDMPPTFGPDTTISKKERTVNCFPFAYPVSYHARILYLGNQN